MNEWLLILIVFLGLIGLLVVLYWISMRLEDRAWKEECAKHPGEKYLSATDVTISLMEMGFERRILGRPVEFDHGMWESDFDRMMNAVRRCSNIDAQCLIIEKFMFSK